MLKSLLNSNIENHFCGFPDLVKCPAWFLVHCIGLISDELLCFFFIFAVFCVWVCFLDSDNSLLVFSWFNHIGENWVLYIKTNHINKKHRLRNIWIKRKGKEMCRKDKGNVKIPTTKMRRIICECSEQT